MQFKLAISCENAAFADHPEQEVARLLRRAATELENHGEPVTHRLGASLFDVNGNFVGTYKFTKGGKL